MAAPRAAIDPVIGQLSSEVGIGKTIDSLRKHLNHSQIEPHKLQAAVSYRVIAQVHGAMYEEKPNIASRTSVTIP